MLFHRGVRHLLFVQDRVVRDCSLQHRVRVCQSPDPPHYEPHLFLRHCSAPWRSFLRVCVSPDV
eukprot:6792382-Heterocapsa_arctica.AAC.1